MKLLSKTRYGAKLTKRFDQARTPYRRALESPYVAKATKDALTATYLGLNPAQLKRELADWQARLLRLTADKLPTRKEVKPPPGPRVRGALSMAEASRTFLVMQPEPTPRTS